MQRPHNWLIYKVIHEKLFEVFKAYASGKLLDIGCGVKPYKVILSHHIEIHVGLDHSATPHKLTEVDLVGTAYHIPADTDSFDTVICTDVLEHLEEPQLAIAEAHRVLKPGGTAIYTTPLFWHLHEQPRDFYRYTEFGLKYLFEKNKFEIIRIVPLGGFWVTLGQETCYYLWGLRRKFLGNFNPINVIILGMVHLVQAISYFLNRFDGTKIFTTEYLVIAKK